MKTAILIATTTPHIQSLDFCVTQSNSLLESAKSLPLNTNKEPLHVVWFKRDLRTFDHRPLTMACARGLVLPLVVIEPQYWALPDTSARQFSFYRETLCELSDELARLGQSLFVRIGDTVEVLEFIENQVGIAQLWSHEETGNAWTFARDLRVRDWCQRHGIEWTEARQDGVVRRLKNRNGWARKWDGLMAEPTLPAPVALHPLPTAFESCGLPTAADLKLTTDKATMRQFGGRREALATLSSFLEVRGETYRSGMSSPLDGETACSRLSPYLAWGALSMREVAQATWRRQRELKNIGGNAVKQWRGSMVSFSGRLHWHCHFMQKLEDEPQLEFQNLHPAYDGLRTMAAADRARFEAWANGETGLPFVDACMRYLAATGWLNFRMRAMLMATASYHLWLDWREPGLHLARNFTDYEPGIHWPQVQMQSGTTGINTVRIYNPVKQSYDQDPDGAFVRRWVPELAEIEGALVHEPWKSPMAAQLLDKSYPFPIVDYMEAARSARQKIFGVRKGGAYRSKADAIQSRHGSRRSKTPMKGGKNASKRKKRILGAADQPEQLQLNLPAAITDRRKV